MLWNTSRLTDFTIEATDGTIGTVVDALFGADDWTLRYLVVDTGAWMSGRRVLLPPSAILRFDDARGVLAVGVTQQQVRDSPQAASDEPVSRQHEGQLHAHYGWPAYWAPYPGAPPPPEPEPEPEPPAPYETRRGDPALRSVSETTGYYIHARDGDIGHVEEFLIDTEAWVVRYAVVDTKNWWPGKMVLVVPQAFGAVDSADGVLRADLSREQIRDAPDYDPGQTIDRGYEARYLGYYGYRAYW